MTHLHLTGYFILWHGKLVNLHTVNKRSTNWNALTIKQTHSNTQISLYFIFKCSEQQAEKEHTCCFMTYCQWHLQVLEMSVYNLNVLKMISATYLLLCARAWIVSFLIIKLPIQCLIMFLVQTFIASNHFFSHLGFYHSKTKQTHRDK